MGANTSVPFVDGALSAVDELGGSCRPASARVKDLNTKSKSMTSKRGSTPPLSSRVSGSPGDASMVPLKAAADASAKKGNTVAIRPQGLTPQRSVNVPADVRGGRLTKSFSTLGAKDRMPSSQPAKGTFGSGPAAKKKPDQMTRKEAAAKKAATEEAEEAAKAGNVAQAKKRLYLYLFGYMKWMTILKSKRQGYADAFTVELLPALLCKALGPSTKAFGSGLQSCLDLAEKPAEAAAKINVLEAGRTWIDKARSGQGNVVAAEPCKSAIGKAMENVGREGNEGKMMILKAGELSSSPLMPTISNAPETVRSETPLNLVRTTTPKEPNGAFSVHTNSAPKRFASMSLDAAHFNARLPPTKIVPNGKVAFGTGALSGTPNGRGLARDVVAAQWDADSLRWRRPSAPLAEDPEQSRPQEANVLMRMSTLIQKAQKADQQKQAVEQMMMAENVDLQMLTNRANGSWVDSHQASAAKGQGFCPPVTLDSPTLQDRGVDIGMYQKFSSQLLKDGKVCIMLSYYGEDQVVGTTNTGAEINEPALQIDLWAVFCKLYPHKVPCAQRLMGLTALDRRMLQVLSDVDKEGGPQAVKNLTVVLCVDGGHMEWVAQQTAARKHWTLEPHQIMLSAICKLPGLLWNKEIETFKATYNCHIPYMSGGSGYAMLSLALPAHAFRVDPEGERKYLSGSVLGVLEKEKVEMVYSTPLCDWESLGAQAPVMDPDFCGPAIYGFDTKGANMAMQVIESRTDQLVRTQNSLVAAPYPGQEFSFNISTADLATPAGRAMVASLVKTGSVVSCTGRYLYSVKHLAKLINGPQSFKLKVDAKAPCAYAYLDQADLTSTHGAQAIAVIGKCKGQGTRIQVIPKESLRELGSSLIAQDAHSGFRGRVSAMSDSGPCPGVTEEVMERGNSYESDASHFLLFVKDNQASRAAYRLLRHVMRGEGDHLTIVHVVSSSALMEDGGAFLSSFSDVLMDHRTKRRLVPQEDKLTETLMAEISLLAPDVVVVGSEALSMDLKGRVAGSMPSLSLGALTTSVALTLAKLIQDCSLLVVKSNSAGDLFQLDDRPGVLSSIKTVIEVQTSSLPLIRWLSPRLDSERDQVTLVRPYGLERGSLKEAPCSARMLSTFAIKVASCARFSKESIKKLPMADGAAAGFPPLTVSEKTDILGLVASSVRVTPAHILDILKTCRTNILVWRPRARRGEVKRNGDSA